MAAGHGLCPPGLRAHLPRWRQPGRRLPRLRSRGGGAGRLERRRRSHRAGAVRAVLAQGRVREMDRKEAGALLLEQLAAYRARPYADLIAAIGQVGSVEIAGPSGRPYQVEVNVLWDDRPGGNVRVLASIDDGGLRSFAPLTDSFIKAPNGSFVGET